MIECGGYDVEDSSHKGLRVILAWRALMGSYEGTKMLATIKGTEFRIE